MGSIFQERRVVATKKLLPGIINSKIDYDESTRRSDEDMYRGDFGSSRFTGNIYELPYKGKKEKTKEKQVIEFMDDKGQNDTPKYTIDAVIYDQTGYLAYKIGFVKDSFVSSTRGNVILMSRASLTERKFKNITELKNWINKEASISTKIQYYKTPVYDSNYNQIGIIGITDQKTYKTKPKNTPKKYDNVEPLYKMAYYGWCPF